MNTRQSLTLILLISVTAHMQANLFNSIAKAAKDNPKLGLTAIVVGAIFYYLPSDSDDAPTQEDAEALAQSEGKTIRPKDELPGYQQEPIIIQDVEEATHTSSSIDEIDEETSFATATNSKRLSLDSRAVVSKRKLWKEIQKVYTAWNGGGKEGEESSDDDDKPLKDTLDKLKSLHISEKENINGLTQQFIEYIERDSISDDILGTVLTNPHAPLSVRARLATNAIQLDSNIDASLKPQMLQAHAITDIYLQLQNALTLKS